MMSSHAQASSDYGFDIISVPLQGYKLGKRLEKKERWMYRGENQHWPTPRAQLPSNLEKKYKKYCLVLKKPKTDFDKKILQNFF